MERSCFGSEDPQITLPATEYALITCGKCRVAKGVDEFHKNLSKKSGRESHCKQCVLARKSKNYESSKLAKLKSEKRRLTTQVATVDSNSITEVRIDIENEKMKSLLSDFIEAVLCKNGP